MAEKHGETDAAIYRSTAAIQLRSFTKAEKDALIDLLQQRVPDATVFDDEDTAPFFWTARASNGKLDSYFTRMAPSSLKNYAGDATDPGVQFQVSHNGAGTGGLFGGGSAGEVGFGRSLRGKFAKAAGEDAATLIDFYTIPGLQCGNMTSDQFIRGARAGIYTDVSIGFTPGQFICSICGGDMLMRWEMDWDDPDRCGHYPGLTYEVGGDTKKPKRELCTATVENSHLNEVSTVYDGATPGAGIVAVELARHAATMGRLASREEQALMTLYRMPITMRTPQFAGVDLEDTMPASKKSTERVEQAGQQALDDEATPDPKDVAAETGEETAVSFEDDGEANAPTERAGKPMERLRRKYEGTGITIAGDPYRSIEVLADTVLSQNSRIKGLEREASDGRAYRESLVADLDASVVRAFGAEKAVEAQPRYRKLAEREDAAGVQALIDDLEEVAKTRFQAGRATSDDPDAEVAEVATAADTPAKRRGPTPARLIG